MVAQKVQVVWMQLRLHVFIIVTIILLLTIVEQARQRAIIAADEGLGIRQIGACHTTFLLERGISLTNYKTYIDQCENHSPLFEKYRLHLAGRLAQKDAEKQND